MRRAVHRELQYAQGLEVYRRGSVENLERAGTDSRNSFLSHCFQEWHVGADDADARNRTRGATGRGRRLQVRVPAEIRGA